MKDYDMSALYHPGKTNVVMDSLSRMSMGRVSHVKDEKKELVHDVHRLTQLGVQLLDSLKGGFMVQLSYESSLVVDVKSKQHLDSIFMELKKLVHGKFVEAFSQRNMGYLGIKLGCVFRMWMS